MGRRRKAVRWARPALDELKNIVQYIASDNRIAAARFISAIRTKVDRLGILPRSGRSLPEFPGSGLREVFHGAYRIIYRVGGSAVEILSVYLGQRLLTRKPGSAR